jgi:hypothetical protein
MLNGMVIALDIKEHEVVLMVVQDAVMVFYHHLAIAINVDR